MTVDNALLNVKEQWKPRDYGVHGYIKSRITA